MRRSFGRSSWEKTLTRNSWKRCLTLMRIRHSIFSVSPASKRTTVAFAESRLSNMDKVCELCDGTGEYTIPNGPDDVEKIFCSCPKGKEQEAINIKLNTVFESDEKMEDMLEDEITDSLKEHGE